MDDITDTVTYLDKVYPVVKLKVKNKSNDKEQDILIGSEEMYRDMLDGDKLAGEEAVKLDGEMSGYVEINDDSEPLKVTADIQSLIADWADIITPIDEGWLDRARAKVSGAVAGAKASVQNTLGKAALKAKAAAQGVKGAFTGDMTKAVATTAKANEPTVDAKKKKITAKVGSIINSIYSDLKLLFPDRDVTSMLQNLQTKLITGKAPVGRPKKVAAVAETVNKETFAKLDRVIELYNDAAEVLTNVFKMLEDEEANAILDKMLRIAGDDENQEEPIEEAKDLEGFKKMADGVAKTVQDKIKKRGGYENAGQNEIRKFMDKVRSAKLPYSIESELNTYINNLIDNLEY